MTENTEPLASPQDEALPTEDEATPAAEAQPSEDTPARQDQDPAKAPAPKKDEALLNEGDLVADYLEELLDIADLDGEIEISVSNGRPHVAIDTDDDRLVGRNGEVLDALQELARLVVMTETGNRSRLTVDVAGHRDKRRAELVAIAKDAIAEVLETGEAVRMPALNAYERKIIHDEIAAAGLVSESEGEPPNRRVVVSK